MVEILEQFADASFVEYVSSFAPAVGWGFLLGIVVAIFGWLWGFVIRLGKLDL